METTKIEVCATEAEANDRVVYLGERGFNVEPAVKRAIVTWSNKLVPQQPEDTAADADGEVWMVIAHKQI